MKIRWIRIVVAAFLLEAVLIALTIPIVQLVGMEAFVPFVPLTVFVVGFPFGFWVVRKVESGFVVHGALVGIVATLIYLGLVLSQFGSIQPAIELYGPFMFFLGNGLRILGCMAGSYAGARRRVLAHS